MNCKTRARNKRSCPLPFSIEVFDPRILLATVSLSPAGRLTIDGSTGFAIDVTVQPAGDRYVVKYAVAGSAQHTRSFPKSSLKALSIHGSNRGGNTIKVQPGVDVPTTLRGGQGTDDIFGYYRDTVIESDFIDNITAVDRNTVQYVWEGPGKQPQALQFGVSDDVDASGFHEVAIGVIDPKDSAIGGEGNMISPTGKPLRSLTFRFTNNDDDVEQAGLSGTPVTFDLRGGDDTCHVFGANVTVKGGPGNDLIEPDGSTSFTGDPALNEVLIGDGGNDTLVGGPGNDTLYGGDGNDSIRGSGANDVLWGGAGDDTLRSGGGHNSLFGQAGDDQLFADNGQKDFLDGGSGFDTAQADQGLDSVKSVEKFMM